MEEEFGAVGVQELRKLEHMMDKNAKKNAEEARYALGLLTGSADGGGSWSQMSGARAIQVSPSRLQSLEKQILFRTFCSTLQKCSSEEPEDRPSC